MRFDSGRTGGQELGAVGARRAITLISTIIIIVVVVSSAAAAVACDCFDVTERAPEAHQDTCISSLQPSRY